jgi:hypothetical protein
LPVIGQQREDPVLSLGVGEGDGIQFPRQMVAGPGLFLVLGVLAGAAWLSLPIRGIFPLFDRHAEPGLDVALGQQFLDGPLHLATLAKACAGTGQSFPQLGQRRQRSLHAARPAGEVQFGLPRAAVPQQSATTPQRPKYR